MQTKATYEIDPNAPCALCGSPSPQNKMNITIDKPQTWGIDYDKFTFSNLPVCNACKRRHENSTKIVGGLALLSVLSCGIAVLARESLQVLYGVGFVILIPLLF